MTTSDSGDAILSRLAKRNDGDITTGRDLADWLESGECPADVTRTAAWAMMDLVAGSVDLEDVPDWTGTMDFLGAPADFVAARDVSGDRFVGAGVVDPVHWRNFRDLVPSTELAGSATMMLDYVGDKVIVEYRGHLTFSSGAVSPGVEVLSYWISCGEMLGLWNRLPMDRRPRDGFPLDILYLAWLNRPRMVAPNPRTTGRIIPARLAHISPLDRQAGKLFTVAAHVTHVSPETGAETTQLSFSGLQPTEADHQQFILPGFKESTTIGPCLPLALYDLGDAPATSRGPAAPLPLRLFVEAVLAVPMDYRGIHTPVAMRVTLRQMLDWLYPNPRKPRPNEYWPRLIAAFEALESPAARIPWYDPETGQGGLRRIVNISDIPRGAGQVGRFDQHNRGPASGFWKRPAGQRQSEALGSEVGGGIPRALESGIPVV